MIEADAGANEEFNQAVDDGAAETEAGLRMVGMGAVGETEDARGSSASAVSGVKASVDESEGTLSVEFQHSSRKYAYELSPRSVYTEDAKVYVGEESIDMGSSRTYISREDGMWVSIMLLGTDMVRGLVEDQGHWMENMPAGGELCEGDGECGTNKNLNSC